METKRKGPANGLGIPLTCCVRACVRAHVTLLLWDP